MNLIFFFKIITGPMLFNTTPTSNLHQLSILSTPMYYPVLVQHIQTD